MVYVVLECICQLYYLYHTYVQAVMDVCVGDGTAADKKRRLMQMKEVTTENYEDAKLR